MSVLVNGVMTNQFRYSLSTTFYTSSRTVAFWCKPSAISDIEKFLFFDGSDPYATIYIFSNSLELDLPDGANTYSWRLSTLNSFNTANIWYHVCVTLDYKQSGRSETDIKAYINGTEASYGYRQYINRNQNFYSSYKFGIGSSPYNEMPFVGEVADYAVWLRMLQPSEITALYNGLSPLHLRKSLTHYIPYIDNQYNLITGPELLLDSSYELVRGTYYQDPIRRHFPSKPKSDFYTFKWWEAPAPQPKKDRPSLIFLGGEIFQF